MLSANQPSRCSCSGQGPGRCPPGAIGAGIVLASATSQGVPGLLHNRVQVEEGQGVEMGVARKVQVGLDKPLSGRTKMAPGYSMVGGWAHRARKLQARA